MQQYTRLLVLVFCAGLALIGCQSLQSPSVLRIIESERASAVTGDALSLQAQNALIASGYSANECMQDFDGCLVAVEAIFLSDDKPKFALLAELHYAYAKRQNDACKIHAQPICQKAYARHLHRALVHSYAYLFYDALRNERAPAAPIVGEEHIRAQDLYHVALHRLINELRLQKQGAFGDADWIAQGDQNGADDPVWIASVGDADARLHIYLANDPYYLDRLDADRARFFDELRPIYDTKLPSLSAVSARSGIGVGFVGSPLDRRGAAKAQTLESPIYPMEHRPMTAVGVPCGDDLDTILSAGDLDVFFYNPYQTKTARILGRNYPLYGNFSAAYAQWLAESPFDSLRIAQNMLKKNDDVPAPKLFMLEPYDPNKKVVVMLHGLASSPKTWVQLTNNLLADPVLRDRYQVWQVFYATQLPILENRYRIQALIEDAFLQNDPTQTRAASHGATLVAHSMGAVIARLMLSSDDLRDKLDAMGHDDDRRLLNALTQNHKQDLRDRLQLRPLRQVDTAVFISAPFRGTDYADRWFARQIRRVIGLPASVGIKLSETLTKDGDFAFDQKNSALGALYLQNGASQLSDKSAFVQLTQDVQISDGVRYHSIMADNQKDKNAQGGALVGVHTSDGVVPYSSSRLQGAASETVVRGGHSVHQDPKIILKLRQILHDKIAQKDSEGGGNVASPNAL